LPTAEWLLIARPQRRFIANCARVLVLVCFSSLVAAAASDKEYVVSTIAGGAPPATPVAARDAAIGGIRGLAADSAGNVYLSSGLSCVFKIDPRGTLTRFAGTCRPGYSGDGGPAVDAQLNDPQGLAVGPNGVVYIADHGNRVVRKVLDDGTIVTAAGNGRPGLPVEGAPATKVPLYNPGSLAADAAGNLYIADTWRIYRVAADGTITTVAGNGTAGDSGDGGPAIRAQVGYPVGLAADARGDLYICGDYRLRRVSATGFITTVAGTGTEGYSGDGGPAISARLRNPVGVAIDREGNLYIADLARVRKISAAGTITTIAGTGTGNTLGDGGPAIQAGTIPVYLAVDAQGSVYLVDAGVVLLGGGRLRRISTNGVISTVLGDGVTDDGIVTIQLQLLYPGRLASDPEGNPYLVDLFNWRIRKINRHGTITTVAGYGTPGALRAGVATTRAAIGSYCQVTYCHVALDANGSLYLSSYGSLNVRKVSSKGLTTTVVGTGIAGFSGDGGPASAAQLNRPMGIALDSAGDLYIADMANQRVRRVAPDGTITTVAGNGKFGHSGDGGPALEAELEDPAELAADSKGNLYILEYQGSQVRKVSPDGVISTVARIPDAPAIAVDVAGTLYAVSNHRVLRLSPRGNLETIAGTGESGYTGDGGPALDARFADLWGITVDRSGRICVSDGHAIRMLRLAPVQALKPSAQGPTDLDVQLRSATGSNRFQIGEQIPLEVVLSSSTPKRYLVPCQLFNETGFGFPRCRFFNRWSFAVRPPGGWTDLEQEFPSGPRTWGGPSFEEPNPDLSSQPVVYPYMLTHRFRFDAPGTYHVRFSMDVGLDDETTQLKAVPDPTIQPHGVNVEREIVLQIVAASPQCQAEIIRKGVEAYSRPMPPATNPPSPEFRQKQQAREALCNLGTAEAARAYANLLVRNDVNHQDEAGCLKHVADAAAAIQEMERLLVDPDIPVRADFFQVLVMLLGRDQSRMDGMTELSQKFVDTEREKLFAALPQKRGEALVASLLTLLAYPPRAKGDAWGLGYNLPFAPPVIAAAAANFDRFPPQSQASLLDQGWDAVRSPLMLPVVRRRAMGGDGQALLRWLELDPPAARAFIREEVVRPQSRFSSFYLRLPEAALPGQEAQIAANFVALTATQDLTRAATLLHRYATGAVLQTVLPFIDARRAAWPCSVLVPALAYLLKVSPEDAEPRFEQALAAATRGACQTNTLFTDIGFLEPGPALDRLALSEIDKGPKSLASDAATYLRKHGSPATKPLLRERLVRWHQNYVESGAEKRTKDRIATNDDAALGALVGALADAYASAQTWLLSPQEAAELESLLGKESTARTSCAFHCGTWLATNPAPSTYWIYGRASTWFDPRSGSMEYLKPAERLYYTINQYRCDDMRALKEKILQFPAGSKFGFAYDFTAADKDEILEIAAFLRAHGYGIENAHNWSFLRPDPPP
jgi:sugar lactone lactonase YvrE